MGILAGIATGGGTEVYSVTGEARTCNRGGREGTNDKEHEGVVGDHRWMINRGAGLHGPSCSATFCNVQSDHTVPFSHKQQKIKEPPMARSLTRFRQCKNDMHVDTAILLTLFKKYLHKVEVYPHGYQHNTRLKVCVL